LSLSPLYRIWEWGKKTKIVTNQTQISLFICVPFVMIFVPFSDLSHLEMLILGAPGLQIRLNGKGHKNKNRH